MDRRHHNPGALPSVPSIAGASLSQPCGWPLSSGWALQADRDGRRLEFAEQYEASDLCNANTMLVEAEVGNTEPPTEAMLKELNTKKATTTSFLFGLKTILKVRAISLLLHSCKFFSLIKQAIQKDSPPANDTCLCIPWEKSLHNTNCHQCLVLSCSFAVASVPGCQAQWACWLQYRMSKDYLDPQFLGPRTMDKLAIAFIIMTLCERSHSAAPCPEAPRLLSEPQLLCDPEHQG